MNKDILKLKILLYLFENKNINEFTSILVNDKTNDLDINDNINELINDPYLDKAVNILKYSNINKNKLLDLFKLVSLWCQNVDNYNNDVDKFNENIINFIQVNSNQTKINENIVSYGGSDTEDTIINQLHGLGFDDLDPNELYESIKFFKKELYWYDSLISVKFKDCMKRLFKKKIPLYSNKKILNDLTSMKEIILSMSNIWVHSDDANMETLIYNNNLEYQYRCVFNTHPFLNLVLNEELIITSYPNELGYIWLIEKSNNEVIIVKNPSKLNLQNLINQVKNMNTNEQTYNNKRIILKNLMNMYPYVFFTTDKDMFLTHKRVKHLISTVDKNYTAKLVLIQQGNHGLCWLSCLLNSIHLNTNNGNINDYDYNKNIKDVLINTLHKHYSVLELLKSYDISKTISFCKRLSTFLYKSNKIYQITDYGSDVTQHIHDFLNIGSILKLNLISLNNKKYLPFINSNNHIVFYDSDYIYDSNYMYAQPLKKYKKFTNEYNYYHFIDIQLKHETFTLNNKMLNYNLNY